MFASSKGKSETYANVSYAANFPDPYRRTAEYFDKNLRGAKPDDLPVEQPIKFDLIINLKTAKALGLTFRDDTHDRAAEYPLVTQSGH
jgi:putative ABC transport system substrate-binding protein